MGIGGLQKFVDKTSVLADFYLHDSEVVIDGDNLARVLYTCDSRFAGDYDSYAAEIQDFFNGLKGCQIKSHVFFDGANEDDQKLDKRLERRKEEWKNVKKVRYEEVTVHPLLMKETFKKVIIELSENNEYMEHHTSTFEADKEIAAKAIELGCPVISNDTDLYIYDVKGGVIPLKSIFINEQSGTINITIKNGMKCIKCQIYYQQTFLRAYSSITKEAFPLFASLLGNDYISKDNLLPFYQAINVPFIHRYKFEHIFSYLLRWFGGLQTQPTIRENVLPLIPRAHREGVQRKLELSVKQYKCPESTECPSIGVNLLPNWVLDKFKRGHISADLINAVVSHKIILKPQVENSHVDSSSHTCSRKLRQIAYSLLILAGNQNCHFVEEYDRPYERSDRINILDRRDESLGQVKLIDIPQMVEEERLTKLLRFMTVSKNKCSKMAKLVADKSQHLLFVAMMYWVRKAEPDDSHLKSLLLCLMCESKTPPPTEPSYSIDIVHAFAQYQSCLQAAIYLNQVLDHPLESPDLGKYLNGTYVHHLARELFSRGANEQRIVYRILQGNQEHINKFHKLLKCMPNRQSNH